MHILESMLAGKITDNIVLTPEWVAQDMVNMLPNRLWVDTTKFLDEECKSGIYLKLIYNKLMDSEFMQKKYPDETVRSEHILKNQLYGLGVNKFCTAIAQRRIYGRMNDNGNIKYIDDYLNIIKDEEKLKQKIKEVLKIMKFDVVIGNPPYNKGMDLDFVKLGFDLCSEYCIMIIPAKWQTAEANQKIASSMSYGEFRQKIVPHMSTVVFYPDCGDVFNIYQMDGISYFRIDKNAIVDTCKVINKCKCQKYFNSEDNRDIRGEKTLHNIGNEIIEYLGTYNAWKFGEVQSNTYEIWSNTKLAKGNYGIIGNDGMTLCLSMSYLINKANNEKSPSEESKCIFASSTREECESFLSWVNSKLVRFLVLMNISKLNGIWTDHYFRFVPAPPSGKFDHIYTDKELYDAFKLPQKYREVIEAVIKERK